MLTIISPEANSCLYDPVFLLYSHIISGAVVPSSIAIGLHVYAIIGSFLAQLKIDRLLIGGYCNRVFSKKWVSSEFWHHSG
ncbi:MAG: hypothetical protein ACP5D7_17790 [Limnospira sp.]